MDVRAKQLLSYQRFLVTSGGLGGGFAPRHLSRYAEIILGIEPLKDKFFAFQREISLY